MSRLTVHMTEVTTPAEARDALLTVDQRLRRSIDYLREAFPDASDEPGWVDLVHPNDILHVMGELRMAQRRLAQLAHYNDIKKKKK